MENLIELRFATTSLHRRILGVPYTPCGARNEPTHEERVGGAWRILGKRGLCRLEGSIHVFRPQKTFGSTGPATGGLTFPPWGIWV
jgi:hypothetical protein